MSTIGVVIARVAAQLRGARGRRQILKLPFVTWTTLFHVVHMLQPLQMFVSLAMQLEICFQVGFIGTELADEVCIRHCKYVALAGPRSIDG